MLIPLLFFLKVILSDKSALCAVMCLSKDDIAIRFYLTLDLRSFLGASGATVPSPEVQTQSNTRVLKWEVGQFPGRETTLHVSHTILNTLSPVRFSAHHIILSIMRPSIKDIHWPTP